MLSRAIARATLQWGHRHLTKQCMIKARHITQETWRLKRTPHQLWTGQHFQSRKASTLQVLKQTWQENPLSVTVASIFLVITVSSLVYANYFYQTYIIGAFSKYPEPVAIKMRRALYYTNMKLEPQEAVKYYKQALQVADEVGMHPFSDEVIGIKLQFAAFFEKVQRHDLAINVLEVVRSDCIRWVDDFGDQHHSTGMRTQVLAKAVQISIKLGELYSSPWIWDKNTAEERLVWGVETALREVRRREEEGVSENEGYWLDNEQIGAGLESLGSHYEEKGQFSYAAPLFLQALTLSSPGTCHRVVLMNNLATSLAQQGSPSTVAQGSRQTPGNSASNEKSPQPRVPVHPATAAQSWAKQALQLAASIKPPERTGECDIGCAVATHNLGEFAEMLGDWAEAQAKYEEAASLADAIGFEEGSRNAKLGITRLKKKKNSSERN